MPKNEPMTVEEYLKQPKEKLYCCGFYKNPECLERGQWGVWRDYLKKTHSVQFFIREVLGFGISYLWCRIKDRWYYLKCLVWKRYHVLKLRNNPTWIDSDVQIELALEKIFVTFVNEERPFEFINWDLDEGHQKAAQVIRNAYDWFTVVRPLKQREVYRLMNELFGGKDYWMNLNKPKGSVLDEKFEKLNKLEKEIEQTNTKMFCEIVKYRGYLWT